MHGKEQDRKTIYSRERIEVFLESKKRKKTYVMRASHSKKFSSLIGPAMMPSGGFKVSSAISS